MVDKPSCGHPQPFELRISDYVIFVDPKAYGILDFESINPADYFVTSGDAVAKAKVLETEMWEVAGHARKEFGKSKTKKQREFVKALWATAGKCRGLLNALIKVRGDAIFLETDWINHRLYVVPKNPRPKKDEPEEP